MKKIKVKKVQKKYGEYGQGISKKVPKGKVFDTLLAPCF